MKKKKSYQIDIFGLKFGTYDYEFEFASSLFTEIEDSIVKSGQGEVKLALTKKETLILLDFKITCELELTCDRSLDVFKYSVNIAESLILKYGEDSDGASEDFWIISSSQESIYIEFSIYEFLTMAVPAKRLHPRFQDTDEEEGLELVYSSREEEKEEENKVDPRWAALKNLEN